MDIQSNCNSHDARMCIVWLHWEGKDTSLKRNYKGKKKKLGQAQVHWKYTERHPKRENKIQMKSNKMQAVQHSNKLKDPNLKQARAK